MDFEAVAEYLASLRLHGAFLDVENYISGISDDAKKRPAVAIHVAGHFFEMGDYRSAAKTLESLGLRELLNTPGALLRPELALLALLSARIEMRRHFVFDEALQLCDQVEDLYIRSKIPIQADEQLEAFAATIRAQSKSWPAGGLTADRISIFDLMVLIEGELSAIQLDALEFGYLDYDTTIRMLGNRYLTTCAILRNKTGALARRAEITYIMSNHRDDFFVDRIESVRFLSALRNAQDHTSVFFVFATRRMAMSQIATEPEEAAAKLEQCSSDFKQRNMPMHGLIVDLLQILRLGRSPENTEGLVALSQKFLSHRNWALHWTCLQYGGLYLYGRPDQRPQFERLRQLVEPSLVACENALQLREVQISTWSSIASPLPSKPEDLEEAINGVAALMSNADPPLIPKHEADALEILHQCYGQLNMVDDTIGWARALYDSDFCRRNYPRKSAAFKYLSQSRHPQIVRLLDKVHINEDERSRAHREAYSKIMSQIEKLQRYAATDAKKNLPVHREEKCQTMFIYFNTIIIRYPDKALEAKRDRLYWTQEWLKGPSINERKTLAIMTINQDGPLLGESIQRADQYLTKLGQNSNEPKRSFADAQLLCALARQSKIEAEAADMESVDLMRLLEETLLYLRESLNTLHSIDESDLWFVRAARIYLKTMRKYLSVRPDRREECLTEIANFLETSEKGTNKLRAAYSRNLNFTSWTEDNAGLKAITQIQQDESSYSRLEVYEYAADFYLQLGKTQLSWKWLQRGRSRGLLAMLSASAAGRFLTNQPFETFDRPGTSLKFEGFRSAESTTNCGPSYQVLNPQESLLVFQDEDIDEIFGFGPQVNRGIKTILIDWSISPSKILTLFTLDSEKREFRAFPLESAVSLATVNLWIRVYLMEPEKTLTGPGSLFQDLKGLFEGLELVSSPGDLLILTPPSQLAPIPLHCIPVDGKPLGFRNPVIYSTSISLFRQCIRRAVSRIKSKHQNLENIIFTGTLDDNATEEQLIKDSLHSLAKSFSSETQPIVGRDLDRKTFVDALQNSPWIHFHGHAQMDTNDPLDQSLLLNRIDTGTQTSEDVSQSALVEDPSSDPPQRQIDPFTCKDVLGLDRKLQGQVVCAIACESSMQELAHGNNHLGFSTALFISGAAAFIGTSWPIYSGPGRTFSAYLYGDVRRQIDAFQASGSESGWINLADAVQQAVIALQRSESPGGISYSKPFYWAPFTLHGSPFYPLTKVRKETPAGADDIITLPAGTLKS